LVNFEVSWFYPYLITLAKDLFSEFSPSSLQDWTVQAAKETKRSPESLNLGSNLWGRLSIQPYYAPEGSPQEAQQKRFHPLPELEGMPPRLWSNVVTVTPQDSNEDILSYLENGAEGLVLPLLGSEDLQQLLEGVLPQYISLFILPLGNPLKAIQAFVDWVSSTKAPYESIVGGLLWSPSDLVFDRQEPFELGIEVLQEVMECTAGFSKFKTCCVKTSRYSESGGNPLDAVSFSIAEWVDIMDRIEGSPQEVFSNLFLEAAVAEHHFGEIARLLAFREGVSSLAALYDISLAEGEVPLFCQTALWSKSFLDVHSNLIRQSTEALAAILGGANFLWVRPLGEETLESLPRRIARNVSSVLREEAHVDKVQDPSGGSFFILALKEQILLDFKSLLLELEALGGWHKALENGWIHQKVRENRSSIQQQYLDGNLVKIGVNTYQEPSSRSLQSTFIPFSEKQQELNPSRATYLVELQTLGFA
jgi:methylmalonyl-CoA mutase